MIPNGGRIITSIHNTAISNRIICEHRNGNTLTLDTDTFKTLGFNNFVSVIVYIRTSNDN